MSIANESPAPGGALTWEPPGPGFWEWQGSHVPAVLTPIYADIHPDVLARSTAAMFARYGVPLRAMEERMVNGRCYAALQPLIGTAGSKPPPNRVLWLVSRLHPEFRRRRRAAERALGERIWRARTQEWRDTLRPALRAANRALQEEPIETFDDRRLVDHVRRAHANVIDGHLLHFDLHGDDMGPLGLFLAACRRWGIDPADAIAAFAGHSPSTTAVVDALSAIRDSAIGSGWTPGDPAPTLDDLRRSSPGVAGAVDRYLAEYGWRVVTGYDLDSRTVGELPEAIVANVLRPRPVAASDDAGDLAANRLHDRVPLADRVEFDECLAEARVALDMRDDNGPITIEWPMGLLRRALLELGRRLVARGELARPEHAVELTMDEVLGALEAGAVVDAEGIAGRADARRTASAIVPPATLGEPDPPLDLRPFPRALAAVIDMAQTAVSLLERGTAPRPTDDGVLRAAFGVGAATCEGTARVVRTADQALDVLEPGDVLVVPFTTPAYNAVLGIAGAVVTEEGGALSHAAVLARELGLAGLIGVPGATSVIPDGARVRVDPAKGTIAVVEPAGELVDVAG